jgi:hypothetical protein
MRSALVRSLNVRLPVTKWPFRVIHDDVGCSNGILALLGFCQLPFLQESVSCPGKEAEYLFEIFFAHEKHQPSEWNHPHDRGRTALGQGQASRVNGDAGSPFAWQRTRLRTLSKWMQSRRVANTWGAAYRTKKPMRQEMLVLPRQCRRRLCPQTTTSRANPTKFPMMFSRVSYGCVDAGLRLSYPATSRDFPPYPATGEHFKLGHYQICHSEERSDKESP